MLRVFALMMKNKVKELKGEKWKSHSLKKTLIPKHAQNKIKKFLSKNKKMLSNQQYINYISMMAYCQHLVLSLFAATILY